MIELGINRAALPYTLFLFLTEFTVGSLLILVALDTWRMVAKSFVKLSAAMVWVAAGLTLLLGMTLEDKPEVGGYLLDVSFMDGVRAALVALFILSLFYTYTVFRQHNWASLAFGGVALVAGLAALFLEAWVFSLPTWGYAALLLSLLAGSLSVGAVTLGMIWGHWYLVTPRIPIKPLSQMTLFLLGALVLQGILLGVNLALPVREVPPSALGLSIAENMFFWLRLGGGLIFPMLLAFLAWQSSTMRATQSATGLLYLAVGAILSGEILARGILFTTAVPV